MVKNVIGYYKVEPKERAYFAVRLIISLLIYIGLATYLVMNTNDSNVTIFLVIIVYTLGFIMVVWLRNGFLIGLIKANSVKINQKQLPEIYQLVEKYSENLGLRKIPSIYLLESGGILNAFATKMFSKHTIVIFAELLEDFYNGNEETIEFVIAHELGHIKRKHLAKEWYLFPSNLFFFITLAYSRACEYTCDNIGQSLSAKGAIKGILTLSGGKKLQSKIDAQEYIRQIKSDRSFWRWLVEKLSTHPNLNKRLAKVYDQTVPQQTVKPVETPTIISNDDHSRYMPL